MTNPSPPGAPPSPATDPLRKARALLALARARRRVFDGSTFLSSDPAWTMALDLFVARAEGRAVSVSSAAIAAQCPVTSALRHLAALEIRQLIVRSASSTDRRIVYVTLTDRGEAMMADCLARFPV